jgi:DNA-directed RNA polymerase subunit N (RpoN/RPB10)
MSEIITCANCNNDLGSIIPLYIYMRNEIQKSYLNEKFAGNTPQSMLTNPDYKLEMGPLMDALGITKMCDRLSLIGMVDNPSLFL